MELTLVAKIKELKEENERLRKIITECEEDNLVLELENTEYKAKLELTKRACCETCKYIDKGMQFDSCLNKIWSGSSECYSCHFDIKKMKCAEWEAR